MARLCSDSPRPYPGRSARHAVACHGHRTYGPGRKAGNHTAVLDGSYQPSPVRRKSIPKPGGRGERLLGIPIVTDRVIAQAIQQVLTPIFDPEFSESSFGFGPGRSAHGVLRQLQAYLRAGYRVAADLDLEKLFDRVVPAGPGDRPLDQPSHPDVLGAAIGRRSVAEGAWLRVSTVVCSIIVNRPVRTRMPGGVGGGS